MSSTIKEPESAVKAQRGRVRDLDRQTGPAETGVASMICSRTSPAYRLPSSRHSHRDRGCRTVILCRSQQSSEACSYSADTCCAPTFQRSFKSRFYVIRGWSFQDGAICFGCGTHIALASSKHFVDELTEPRRCCDRVAAKLLGVIPADLRNAAVNELVSTDPSARPISVMVILSLQQRLGTLHAAAGNVAVRRLAEGLLEHVREMIGTEPDHVSKGAQRDVVTEVILNVLCNALFLPRCQSTANFESRLKTALELDQLMCDHQRESFGVGRSIVLPGLRLELQRSVPKILVEEKQARPELNFREAQFRLQ